MHLFQQKLQLNQPITNRRDFALSWTVFAVLISFVVMLLRTRARAVIPFTEASGQISLGALLIEITFVVSFFVTVLGFRRYTFVSQSASGQIRRLQTTGKWLTRLAIAMAFGIVATTSSVFVFSAVGVWLSEARFPDWLVLAICVVYTGIFTYFIAFFISGRGQTWLLYLAAGVFGGGLVLAIVVAPDLTWWTNAISFLGGDVGGIFFNMAFIITGLILLAVLQDRMMDLTVMRDSGLFDAPKLFQLHLLLLAMCIGITGIGLFPFIPNTASFILHQISANLAALAFIACAFVTPKWLPIFPDNVFHPSLGMGLVAIVVAVGHYIFQFYNFSLMELLLIGLGAIWVSLFFGISGVYIKQHRPDLLEI